jgi:hypothetical protein
MFFSGVDAQVLPGKRKRRAFSHLGLGNVPAPVHLLQRFGQLDAVVLALIGRDLAGDPRDRPKGRNLHCRRCKVGGRGNGFLGHACARWHQCRRTVPEDVLKCTAARAETRTFLFFRDQTKAERRPLLNAQEFSSFAATRATTPTGGRTAPLRARAGRTAVVGPIPRADLLINDGLGLFLRTISFDMPRRISLQCV